MDIKELVNYKVLFAMTPFAISTLVSFSDPKENETLKQELSTTLVKPTRSNLEDTISTTKSKKELSPEQQEVLLVTVKTRFEANMNRHNGIEWSKVEAKLKASPQKMWSLSEMERTGGEPDLVDYDVKTNEYIFFDCSKESPEGRRNCVYDKEVEDWLKKNLPQEEYNGNAVDMAGAMGIDILTEEKYRYLQNLGEFDRNTWSWVKTPDGIRKSGFALFGDRFNVVIYVDLAYAFSHSDRGAFRGSLRV